MGTKSKLARLAPGMTLEVSSGGIPALTREDILGALGYANLRVPRERVGVHLVLAKYALDTLSMEILEDQVSGLAWMMWKRYGRRDLPVPVRVIDNIAVLAVLHWVHPDKVHAASDNKKAKFVGVDRKTWLKHYLAHYGRVMVQLAELEWPVIYALQKALNGSKS